MAVEFIAVAVIFSGDLEGTKESNNKKHLERSKYGPKLSPAIGIS